MSKINSLLSTGKNGLERYTPLRKPLRYPKPVSMKKFKTALTLVLFCVSGLFFHNFTLSEVSAPVVCVDVPTEDFSEISRNGKLEKAEKQEALFVKDELDELGFPVITEEVARALEHQLDVLENSSFKNGKIAGNLDLGYEDMKEVLQLLINRAGSQPTDLNQYLEAWQSWGDDKQGNVLFTGYYTPAMKVKTTRDNKYKYPLYAYPKDWKGPLPTREAIDKKGALKGKGLELAYAADPIDIYVMQLQGSGTVEFVDTKVRMLFRYAGENGRPYRNIQHFFKNRSDLSISNVSMSGIRRFLAKNPHLRDSVLFYNPSYTFFTPKTGLAKGAGEVPLIEGVSIAADPRYFPMGSVVLAAMPVYEGGKVTHHKYKILLPQDVGGAIKGAGHVDVYCGTGDYGRRKAAALHHYGRMWVLKPKKNEQVAMLE